MNATREAPSKWTARQWVMVTLLVYTAHLAAASWFSRLPGVTTVRQSPNIPVRLVVSSSAWRRPGVVLELPDPTTFALVSEHGFSSAAWLRISRLDYTMTNRSEPVPSLELPADDLAADFGEYVQTNLLSEDVALDQVNPVLANPGPAEPIVVAATTVRLEGALAARPLLPGAKLPKQPEPILTNSVVQVSIRSDGRTVSAALLTSCGVGKADRDALAFAASARFAPVPGEAGILFGNLVFQWSGVEWKEAR